MIVAEVPPVLYDQMLWNEAAMTDAGVHVQYNDDRSVRLEFPDDAVLTWHQGGRGKFGLVRLPKESPYNSRGAWSFDAEFITSEH